MNGAIITTATTLDSSLTLRAVVDAPFLNEAEKLKTLFLAAYSRPPRPEERERLLKVIQAKPDDEKARGQAYANIFWALLNSPELAPSLALQACIARLRRASLKRKRRLRQ
jgi:hypothetical protein